MDIFVNIFAIIGLYALFRWAANRSRTKDSLVNEAAAEKIRSYSASHPELRVALEEIAAELSTATASPGYTSHVIYQPGEVAPVIHHAAHPSARHSTHKEDMAVLSKAHAAPALDNINLILYLGAFLVVVSAGIFVGYNFETLSGTFKTIFLGLFAAIFYLVGLWLYLRQTKLRPAGVTFTGIGLVLVPLVGLAAYNFTSLHDHGPGTWFVTSVITLAFYILTLRLTRQSYVAYLVAFTTLSNFESGISLFNFPVYWFGWGMATTSILLLTLTRFKLLKESSSALLISANIFMPLSLLMSLSLLPTTSVAQLGITIGLAGIFYAAMAGQFASRPEGSAYWTFALVSLPAALGIGLWDTLSRGGVAAVAMLVCVFYLAMEHLFGAKLHRQWRELFALVTGLLPLAGMAVMYNRPAVIVAILVATVLINIDLALRLRASAIGFIAIIAFLALPVAYARNYINPELSWSWVAAMYILAAGALVWWSRRMDDWPNQGSEIGAFGYVSALILALVSSALSSQAALAIVSFAVAAAFDALSFYTKRLFYVYAAASCLYLAALQPAGILDWPATSTCLLLLLAGAAVYALGWAENDSARSQALRYSGIIGPFLGAFATITLSPQKIQPALALGAGGFLLLLEGRRQSVALVQEIAGGIMILSLNWFCWAFSVDQTQAYSLPWAAYSAYLGYRRRAAGHSVYDGFTAVALFFLTLPLATQALGDNGQVYGLILILVGIALVFIGMAMSYRLITIWGASTLVAEVLYQLRDFFYALPKYFISAGLGIALLATAIIMLQRRKGDD